QDLGFKRVDRVGLRCAARRVGERRCAQEEVGDVTQHVASGLAQVQLCAQRAVVQDQAVFGQTSRNRRVPHGPPATPKQASTHAASGV
ncbi:hypothetical protein GGI00_004280, partial [Coemansia sp. RSA 2681]